MKNRTIGILAAIGALGVLTTSLAFTQPVSPPQVSQINPADLFQDIVNGQPTPGNVYAPASLFSAYFGAGAPSRGNAIIGGDATTNLWQRGTAGSATTSATPTYNAPDRFAQWVPAAASSITVSRSNTAADLPTGYLYDIKVAHTNTTAGQICIGQVVATVNSLQFQSATAELDFHAATGAGYTGGSTLTAYIYTGTAADEGMTSMAAGSWTGQATTTAAVVPLSAVSTNGRFAAVSSIPANAKEIGIALCYTAGTTDTNDYVALDGIQLIRNSANAAFVNSGVGYNCASTANLSCASFWRRLAAQEAYFQYTYFQEWADNLAATFVLPETCAETTSGTTATCLFNLPVAMRTTTPTVVIATATSFGMTKVADGTAEACTTFAVVTSTATANNFKATCAVSETAAVGTMHIGLYANTGASSTLTVSSEL